MKTLATIFGFVWRVLDALRKVLHLIVLLVLFLLMAAMFQSLRDATVVVLTAGNLPAGVGAPRYGVMPKTTATFTFSATDLRGACAKR